MTAPTFAADVRRTVTDPARLGLLAATLLALVVPAVSWFGLDVPGRGLLAVAFLLLAPGTALAVWVTDDRRALWCGLAPALSLAVWALLTVAQALTNTIDASWTASLIAAVHAVALPGAWTATGRERVRRAPADPRRQRAVAVVGLLLAVGLWWRATRTVDLDRTGALGLLGVAPATYWLALALVAAIAAWTLTRARVDRLLASLVLVTFATVVYAFVGVADGVPVVPTTFVHLGITDAIQQLRFLPSGIEARFSWPGFFTTAGAVDDIAGSPDLIRAFVWYPVLVNVLLLGPLVVLGRALTGSERVGWVGAFVFLSVNWVQQDYFAPQSMAFLLLVVVLAVLAELFRGSAVPPVPGHGLRRVLRLPGRTPGRPDGWSGRRLIALEATLVVVGAGLAVSHQLTPPVLVVITGGLALLGVIRQRTLWLGFAVTAVAWFAFGAEDWWSGHFSLLIDGFGSVDEAVSGGGLERVSGDPWYARLQVARGGWSLLVAAVALAGWWGIRRRPAATFAAVCVVAPAVLVGAQPYGGEILLRVLLYASPVLAVLAAAGLLRAVGRWPRTATALVAAAFVVGGVAVTVTRGLNTAFERTPADVVAAADQLLAAAPAHSTIAPLRAEATLQMRRFRELDAPLAGRCPRTPLECLLRDRPDYVFLTTTRDAYDALRNQMIPDFSRRLAHQLLTSGRYRVWSEQAHVIVLERVGLVRRPPEVSR